MHDLCSQKEIKLSTRPGRNLQGHPLRDLSPPVGLYLFRIPSSTKSMPVTKDQVSVHMHESMGTFHTQAITQKFT